MVNSELGPRGKIVKGIKKCYFSWSVGLSDKVRSATYTRSQEENDKLLEDFMEWVARNDLELETRIGEFVAKTSGVLHNIPLLLFLEALDSVDRKE